ncbi:MAG: DUF2752 domain-containing protein [Polyangiaceae bacterium]|nr:DUF2752 domain-containing protein [Polyangiaceae bacterium]
MLLAGLPGCPTATIAGIPCPGCGLTRASWAVLRGDLAEAHRLHPLVLIVTPLYLGFLAYAALDYVRGEATRPRSPRAARALSAAAMTVLVLLLVVWLARFAGFFGGPVPVQRAWS